VRTLVLVTALSSLFAFGSRAMAMPVPPDVKLCVVFLYVTDSAGKAVPNGTGFLVAVPHPTDSTRMFSYLVTAGHVTKQSNGGPLYPEMQVRLQRRDGSPEFVRVPLVASGPGKNIFLPSDPTVDLAVIPFSPDQAKYDFKVIPADFLPTDAELKELPVQEGADVFFAGLFLQHVSDRANLPIFRFGRVALASSEPIPWAGVPRHLLLIECSSYGGNSGAPVFYYLGAERNPGSVMVGAPILKLAGVMMGAYQDVRPLQVVNTSQVAVATSNLGIAAVVPVARLRDLIFGTELSAMRSLISSR
jgi:hypothetical protein